MHGYGKTYYNDLFKENICSVCRLCEPRNISFCMVAWGGDKNRFYKILEHLNTLRIKDNEIFGAVRTFEGFCGVFCNTGKPCRQYSDKCENLNRRISCYSNFAIQFSRIVTLETRARIWELFSDVETKDIGRDYRTAINKGGRKVELGDPLRLLSKKQRRRVRKTIKAARNTMRASCQSGQVSALKKVNNSKKNAVYTLKRKKELKTELFCNDDEEWRAKIEEYLGQNETNNRQPTDSAWLTKGR